MYLFTHCHCVSSSQDELSLRYELSGGFIKNAILSALSIAVSRDGENPVVCLKDLQQGANLQLRGALRMKVVYDTPSLYITTLIHVCSPSTQDFHRRVLPSSGLDKVVVEEKLMKTLREIVQFEKARSVLFGQWGFGVSEQQVCTQYRDSDVSQTQTERERRNDQFQIHTYSVHEDALGMSRCTLP